MKIIIITTAVTIILGLGGVVWNGHDNRIAALEASKESIADRLPRVETKLDNLKTQQDEMMQKINEIERQMRRGR